MQRDSPLVLHGDNPLQFGDKLEVGVFKKTDQPIKLKKPRNN